MYFFKGVVVLYKGIPFTVLLELCELGVLVSATLDVGFCVAVTLNRTFLAEFFWRSDIDYLQVELVGVFLAEVIALRVDDIEDGVIRKLVNLFDRRAVAVTSLSDLGVRQGVLGLHDVVEPFLR